LYTLRIPGGDGGPSRDEVRDRLAERGVGSRLYYPALHHQGVFEASGPFDPSDYPRALEYEQTALSLPLFPGLTGEEQDYVIDNLLAALDGEGSDRQA